MDNASKALIMAGAILLAVAIVGLGVYMFSMASGLIDTAGNNFDNLSIEQQNNQLLQYEGGKVKGSLIVQLQRKIDIISGEWPEEIGGNISEVTVNKNKYYGVSMELGDSGYVGTINITGDGIDDSDGPDGPDGPDGEK